MADGKRLICASTEVVDKGNGVRFALPEFGERATGFVIRFEGRVQAYLNQRAHVPVELDWNHGEFFDRGGRYLICATHGALYLPENGDCVGGPCQGRRLRRLAVVERDGHIYLDL